MKINQINKFVVIVVSVTLTVTQAIPAGWAVPAAADQLQGMGVPTAQSAPAVSAQEAQPEQKPVIQVPAFRTTTNFLNNSSPLSQATTSEEINAAPVDIEIVGPGGENPNSNEPSAAPVDMEVVGPGGENPDSKEPSAAPVDMEIVGPGGENPESLEEKVPSAVQEYADALQEAFGSGYDVSVMTDEEGNYLIAVNFKTGPDCDLSGPCPNVIFRPEPGQLTHMSFGISADGTPDLSTLSVQFNIDDSGEMIFGQENAPKVDGALLYAALQQIVPVSSQDDPAAAILSAMAKVTVSQVEDDGTIHFALRDQNYKAYRTEDGNVIVEKSIPDEVQAYADQLQEQLGDDFEVTISILYPRCAEGTRCLNSEPEYRINVLNIGETRPGSLKSMSFNLQTLTACPQGGLDDCTTAYVLDPDSLKAVYQFGLEGELTVEGALLYEALSQLVPTDAKTDRSLALLEQIANTKVYAMDEDGTIHFRRDNNYYTSYRAEDGSVIVKEALPGVQKLVERLLEAFPEYEVSVTPEIVGYAGENPIYSGNYIISISDPNTYTTIPSGRLQLLSFKADKNGKVLPETVSATYYDVSKVDGALLYAAVSQLIGQTVEDTHSVWALRVMSRIKVFDVDEDGTIHFARSGKFYKGYRAEDGSVQVEKDLHVGVRRFVERLREQFPGYEVTAMAEIVGYAGENPIYSGDYIISIVDPKEYTTAPTGRLHRLSFELGKDWLIQPESVKAVYYDVPKVDGALLYEAIGQLVGATAEAPRLVWVLKVMAAIKVLDVDKDGTIHFKKDGDFYKCYRSEDGSVQVEKEEPPVPEGWTRSASNPNFAFQTTSLNGYSTLNVQDLRTGTIQQLYSLQSPPNSYTGMDVSPDGKFVFFGVKNNYTSPTQGWLRVQRMDDLSQKTDLEGILSEVRFLPNGDLSAITLTQFRNGTELGNVYTVNHTTLEATLTNIKLVTQASAVLDSGYLIIPEQITYSNTYQATIYDVSAGTSNLVKLDYEFFYYAGPGGSGSYTEIDAYTTPEGRTIISVGILAVSGSTADASKTFIFDPMTKETLTFAGAVTAISYNESTADGSIGCYSVTYQDGTTAVVYVNLKTLQIVPPPAVPQLDVGEFQAEGCLVPDSSTSVASTSCVGFVGTPNGTVEVHTYNSRGNTGVIIYDDQQTKSLDYSIPSMSGTITQATISSDGKYLAVGSTPNRVNVVSLTVPEKQDLVLIPEASGFGIPYVDEVRFVTSTRILVTTKDGSGRKFYVGVQTDGSLLLLGKEEDTQDYLRRLDEDLLLLDEDEEGQNKSKRVEVA